MVPRGWLMEPGFRKESCLPSKHLEHASDHRDRYRHLLPEPTSPTFESWNWCQTSVHGSGWSWLDQVESPIVLDSQHKVHIPSDDMNPSQAESHGRSSESPSWKNGIDFPQITITNFFHNQAIAMGVTHYNDGLLCHDGNTSKSFLTAKARWDWLFFLQGLIQLLTCLFLPQRREDHNQSHFHPLGSKLI